jgi:hypothetical protein
MSILEKIGEKLGELESKYPKRFLWLIFLITLLMVPGLFQMKIEPSLEKVLPQDLPVLKDMNFMRDQFGADMIYIIYDIKETSINSVLDPKVLKQIEITEKFIEREQNILMVNSFSKMIKDYNDGVIPEDKEKIKEIYLFAKNKVKDPRANLISFDQKIILSEIKSNTGASANDIKEVVNSIQNNINRLNLLDLNIGFTGYNVLDKATFEVILGDFSYTTFLSFIFIAIVVYLTFKSLIKGMIPMVIVMISLLWTNGTVGYLGIAMTVASMGAAAMVMGLGIDFGIHLISIFDELRLEGKKIKEAMVLTLKKDIRAIVGTSITTIAGFMSLWFSSLPAMEDLGTILLIGIFYSMILALLGMMPLIYFYEKRKLRKIS